MRKITVARLSEFLRYQWVLFLALYWGLRMIREPVLSQNISFFIGLMLAASIGWLAIAIIGHDREIAFISRRAMRELSVSLLLVLASEILVILWVFIEFPDGVPAGQVWIYLVKNYALWITLPIACLILEKNIRKKE